jgi:DNA-binding beta-propeller fold protein YncE
MRTLAVILALAIGSSAAAAMAQAPYRIVQTVKVGGDGGFDYVYADSAGRKLYIPRSGPTARVMVLDLDTLAPVGELAGVNGHGAAVDPRSGHGFASSRPIAMWDAKTLAPIKTIEPQGNPDGILGDPSSQKIYILSHSAPNVTVINAADGAVAGTIDLGAAPEQAVTDGKGHLYIDLEDKDQVAVVDAASMKMTGAYGLDGKCGTPAGLAIDVRNRILFVACRNPATMTMLNADTGKILGSVPIGAGVDGAVFNPATLEAFSSQGDGTLTVVKETSPTTFAVEQTVQTPIGAKTLTLDAKTGRVLLITAEFGPPPAPVPGAPASPPGRPRRGPMLPGSFAVIVVGK